MAEVVPHLPTMVRHGYCSSGDTMLPLELCTSASCVAVNVVVYLNSYPIRKRMEKCLGEM
jgi:hypothetical protein